MGQLKPNSDDSKRIGNYIKRARQEKGWTQAEFSEILSDELKRTTPYSRAAVSYWETGATPLPDEAYLPICKLLNIKPIDAALFGQGSIKESRKIAVAKTLKDLRKRKKYTMSDMLNKINVYFPRRPYTLYAYRSWESKTHLPPQKVLKAVCNIFNVPFETTFPMEALYANKKPFSQRKIDVEKLAQYDGMPVYCTSESEKDHFIENAWWGLVNMAAKCIIHADGSRIPFNQIDFCIYARPMPFTSPQDIIGNPLTPEQVKQEERLWIEPITSNLRAKQNLRCWGSYNKDQEMVVGNNHSFWNMDEYGQYFLCFSEECFYESLVLYDPQEEIADMKSPETDAEAESTGTEANDHGITDA